MRCCKKNLGLMISLLALILSLLPEYGVALGFGQIRLYSYLNEPLEAEIDLTNADEIDPGQIIATLASTQDFKRAEMARPYYLNQLQFEVVHERKRNFIRVTTEDPVRNPFLEFLVVMSWPEGKTVRGFTVLLDPASMGGAASRQENKKQHKTNIPTLEKQAVILKYEQLSEGKKQEKLADAISKPTMLAQLNEHNTSIDSDQARVIESLPSRSRISQPLENLFENADKQEVRLPPIPKSPPVSVMESAEPTGILEDDDIIVTNTKKSAPKKNSKMSPLSEITTKIGSKPESAFNIPNTTVKNVELPPTPIRMNEKVLFLLSGLSLLLIVASTVWVLKRNAGFKVRNEAKNRYAFFDSTFFKFISRTTNIPKSTKEAEEFQFHERMALKLNLARQYIDIQDIKSAKEILEEIVAKGDKYMQNAAKALLDEILMSKQDHLIPAG